MIRYVIALFLDLIFVFDCDFVIISITITNLTAADHGRFALSQIFVILCFLYL